METHIDCSKMWHSQDLKCNWFLSKSIKNKLDRQTIVFVLATDHNKYKQESNYNISFTRS